MVKRPPKFCFSKNNKRIIIIMQRHAEGSSDISIFHNLATGPSTCTRTCMRNPQKMLSPESSRINTMSAATTRLKKTSTASFTFSRGLGWRMHLGVEVTELSTNKQHHLTTKSDNRKRTAPSPTFTVRRSVEPRKCVCVYYCTTYYKAVRVGRGG